MRRLFALLALAACSEPASNNEPPAPIESAKPPPVTWRTAPPIPPRVLHAEVRDHGVLPSGDLLVALTDGSTHTVDPRSGATSPWPLPWRPANAGWHVTAGGDGVSALASSLDGKWLALAIPFTRSGPRNGPWLELHAIVVMGPDAGAARCLGLSPFDRLEFTGDSTRLAVSWPLACEPGPDNAPTLTLAEHESKVQWFDLQRGTRSAKPEHLNVPRDFRDPLGDAVLVATYRPPALHFYSSSTGAALGAAELPGAFHGLHAWVRPDAVHITHEEPAAPAVYFDDHLEPLVDAIGFADGRVIRLDAPLTIYTRLPNDEVLFDEGRNTDGRVAMIRRDPPSMIHQGRIDWQIPRILASIPRSDLADHPAPAKSGLFAPWRYTWTPALGGLLIHRAPDGPLEWAGL